MPQSKRKVVISGQRDVFEPASRRKSRATLCAGCGDETQAPMRIRNHRFCPTCGNRLLNRMEQIERDRKRDDDSPVNRDILAAIRNREAI